jgi:Helix-turn-helix domain
MKTHPRAPPPRANGNDIADVMRPAAAAAYLDTTAKTLATWRCRGGGPPFTRLGRSIRYRRGDLDAFLVGRTVRSTSEYGVELREG